MRGKIAIGAAILAALLVGMITVSFAAGPGLSNPTRIHVVEHRLLPTVVREMMAECRAR